jgi:hypothetical protein
MLCHGDAGGVVAAVKKQRVTPRDEILSDARRVADLARRGWLRINVNRLSASIDDVARITIHRWIAGQSVSPATDALLRRRFGLPARPPTAHEAQMT